MQLWCKVDNRQPTKVDSVYRGNFNLSANFATYVSKVIETWLFHDRKYQTSPLLTYVVDAWSMSLALILVDKNTLATGDTVIMCNRQKSLEMIGILSKPVRTGSNVCVSVELVKHCEQVLGSGRLCFRWFRLHIEMGAKAHTV